ncbi:M28 family metallopeptidase [Heliomicrobium modesticaldum]|uniref:M28 family metallopeptidase n=1 Tax=Heliomicrobium modesticaldum TaxID=35701 RepID=UPI0011D0784D|nr:M28 family peptidase [Heliomicrobium modesticaldum]
MGSDLLEQLRQERSSATGGARAIGALPESPESAPSPAISRRRMFWGAFAAVTAGLAGFFGSRQLNAEKPVLVESPAVVLPERRLDLGRMRSHVALLAQPDWQGRLAGSRGALQAGEYIAQLWEKWGIEPRGEGGTYFQTFPVPSFSLTNVNGRMRLLPRAGEGGTADNLIGFIPGRDPRLRNKVVALSAHYDHLGAWDGAVYPGANDNASGVAVLLEIACAAVKTPPRCSLAFFLFSGEEGGLLGSKHYAEHPTIPLEDMIGLINLDTVGNGDERDFICWIPEEYPWLSYLDEAGKAAGVRLYPQEHGGHNSDHQPFVDKGVAAITVLSASWLEGNHTPQDGLSLIRPEKLARIAEWSWRAIYNLAETAGRRGG